MLPALQTLGNVIGGARYFGACGRCRAQFMSTHDRVAVDRVHSHVLYCERCSSEAK